MVISNASELQGYTVRALYRAFQTSTEQVVTFILMEYLSVVGFSLIHLIITLPDNFHQESFVRVAVWCIGEYGEMLVNSIGMLDIEDPMTVSCHQLENFLVGYLLLLHVARK